MTEVNEIAVIGAGPAGLVAANEFLHTARDGSSTITSPGTDIRLPADPAFSKITVFERNSDIGGVWYYSKKPDIKFPSGISQYSHPKNITKTDAIPKDILEGKTLTYDQPYTVQAPINENNDGRSLWNKSAVYDSLFTNVPIKQMIFTSGSGIGYENDGPNNNPYYPFGEHKAVQDYLHKYAISNNLYKHIRFNTSVEKVYKENNSSRWKIVAKRSNEEGESAWYTEEFDAVLVSNGKSNIPYFPKIKGLQGYTTAHPDVVQHSKSLRNFKILKDKKVLIVGSSISSIDLLQYFIPLTKETGISIDADNADALSNNVYKWVDDILQDKELKFTRHSKIVEFDGDTIVFANGERREDFDKVIFATGYHIYSPFLDFPENRKLSGLYYPKSINDITAPIHSVKNTFLDIFKLEDPTLAFQGIPPNAFFFVHAESNAAVIAGVWSGAKLLPSREEQEKIISNTVHAKHGRILYEEDSFELLGNFAKYYPRGRYDVLKSVSLNELKSSKNVLKILFYEFASGKFKNIVVQGSGN